MSAVCKGVGTIAPVCFRDEDQGQGIRSILGLSTSSKGQRESLERTFLAHMSPGKRWTRNLSLNENLSLEEFSTSTTATEGKGDEEKQEEAKEEPERQSQFDVWSAIQLQKAQDSNSTSPPYTHPLVKQSSSILSQKSLEVCTESLGSESGSDGFSSFDDLDHSLSQQEEEEEEEEEEELEEEVKYNSSNRQRSHPRSFPPPLPSLSRRDGPCLHVRPYRSEGRLVLEAVRVPSYTYFRAQRQGGRLILTFIDPLPSIEQPQYRENNAAIAKEEEQEQEKEQEQSEEDPKLEFKLLEEDTKLNKKEDKRCVDNANVVQDKGLVIEVKIKEDTPIGLFMQVHSSALLFKCKPFKNPNPFADESSTDIQEPHMVAHLTTPFNGYGCPWKSSSSKPMYLETKDFLLVRSCNEAQRPLLITEARCIVTS